MVSAIEALGCRVGALEELVVCISSETHPGLALTGGFAPHTGREVNYEPRVVMVEEHNLDQATFDRTLVHELVHAYDQCRANVDWTNTGHLACSEVRPPRFAELEGGQVRASNLSGECDFVQELNRGKLGFVKHQQTCVKRRAALSVCLGHQTTQHLAERAVADVYDRCYRDRAPFDDDDRGL